MKFCPICKTELKDTAKFCSECGFDMRNYEGNNAKKVCKACGAVLEGGKFCDECGTPVSEVKESISGSDVSLDSIDFSALNAKATDQLFENKGFEVDNGVLIKYTGKKRYVTVPGIIDEIYDGAFEGNDVVTIIEIEEGIRFIGKRAFAKCGSLISLTIPSTVKRLYDGVLEDTHLEELVLSKYNNGVYNDIVKHALSVDAQAAVSCGEASIDDYIISEDGKFTVKIMGLEAIGEKKREEREQAEKAEKAEKAEREKKKLYDDFCSVAVFDGGKIIEYKGKEKSVVIPDGFTSIEKKAFSSCKTLTSITIPNSVTEIGEYAFASCTSLTSITIPSSVIGIGSYVFVDCTSLTEILVDCGNKKYKSIDGNLYTNDERILLKYAAGKKDRKFEVPNSIMEIEKGAFDSCTSLTSIAIPNSVTEIGEYAFDSCTSLTSITLPNSITEISDFTFDRCKSLTNITIPNSVIKIGGGAFASCENLTTLTIPNSVTEIAVSVFWWCDKLKNVKVPRKLLNKKISLPNGAEIIYY